jgi:glycolate oxidase FAD binding subunit
MTQPASNTMPQSPGRAVDGVIPRATMAPESLGVLHELLRESRDLGIVITTNGTKLDFGAAPSRYDLEVDLSRLPRYLDHSPGDLVVRASANTPLRELNATLAAAGQRLSIDEVVTNSTVGGIVATALSGPLRYRFGAVRDLLIGVGYARADGTPGKAGGIVVKNVAGYDLSKLLCGSYGTLAVLTECIFRLHPLPARTRVLIATLSPDAAVTAAHAIASGIADVTAIEVNIAPGQLAELAVLIEGSTTGSAKRSTDVASIIGRDVHEHAALPTWWGTLPGSLVVKVAFASTFADDVIAAIQRCGGEGVTVRGSLALGLLSVALDDAITDEQLASILSALRDALLPFEGSVQVLRAQGAQKTGVDVFGPVPGLELMGRIKAQFDPKLTLGPGRFVGGW